ncbi:MAG: hypothetical protein HKN73_20995 [Gemmatimonadetes bacterium]|nr:hypothetical protein [Gemmatimonadota bacterium]
MKRLLRRALRRTRSVFGVGEPSKKRVLPLTRDTYGVLGGDFVIPNLAGVLRLSRLDPAASGIVEHESVLVPGFGYDGMEDNDMRGHLDGSFQYAWNQVSQKYVRTGRIDNLFQYGEYELFRALQRWNDLPLPDGARVAAVELRLRVQPSPIEYDRTLLLYAMRRDWNPGGGGTGGDNLTPPAQGEVWWNDAKLGEDPWGLPGGSSSTDRDPAPLAEAILPPGGEDLRFSSESLTTYVAARAAEGLPLLFMIKLQDHQEDVPGSIVYLWAESEGDDRTRGRKPELAIRWTTAGEAVLEEPVLLEPGRELVYPAGQANFVAFEQAGSEPFEVSGRDAGGAWRVVEDGRLLESEREVRIRAVSNGIPFGGTFTATFRDTWVRTGPPEEQDVVCRFSSPTGRRLESLARYDGDYTWTIEVSADEVGRWRYHWAHELQPGGFQALEGTFDVVVETVEDAIEALREFKSDVIAVPFDDRTALSRLMVRFSKLERAVMATLTTESFRSEDGRRLRDAIKGVRAAFGRPVPDPIPLKPADPHPWEAER